MGDHREARAAFLAVEHVVLDGRLRRPGGNHARAWQHSTYGSVRPGPPTCGSRSRSMPRSIAAGDCRRGRRISRQGDGGVADRSRQSWRSASSLPRCCLDAGRWRTSSRNGRGHSATVVPRYLAARRSPARHLVWVALEVDCGEPLDPLLVRRVRIGGWLGFLASRSQASSSMEDLTPAPSSPMRPRKRR